MIIFKLEPFQEKFLTIHLEEGLLHEGSWVRSRAKKLYLSELKMSLDKEDRPLLDFLATIQLHYSRKNGLGNDLQTLELNRILLNSEKAFDFFQLLQSKHVLFFQNRRLHFERKIKGKFYFLACSTDLVCEAEGRIIWNNEDFSLSECEFFLPLKQILFLYKNQLGFLETNVHWKWILALRQKNMLIKDKKILEEENDPFDPYSPKTIYKGKKEIEILPILKLQDSTLCFADLWLDYEGASIGFSDTATTIQGKIRDKVKEKSWEKDLLEAGFQKKVSHSHYFCPSEKIGEVLQLLLEIGWKIEDKEKRELLPLTCFTLSITEKNEKVHIQGEIFFSDQKMPLSQIASSWKSKTTLLDLGQSRAGLITESLQRILPLKEIPSLTLSKSKLPLLAPLLKDDRVLWEKKTRLLAEGLTNTLPEAPPSIISFQAKLYPFQKYGVDFLFFLYENSLGGLLADEMGLGKTVQILAFFSRIRTNLPLLVVCPSSLIYNWKAETTKFLPEMKPYLHVGSKRFQTREDMQCLKFIITSYALLRQDHALFSSLDFAVVVLDESSAIKNDLSITAQIAYQLKSKARIALNGTPIENSYEELWSQFHFLEPSLLGSKKDFFQSIEDDGVEYVRKKIRPLLLKRTKRNVNLELPSKIEQIVWVEMEEEEKEIYETLKEDAIILLEEQYNAMKVLEKILRLRQLLCHPLLLKEVFKINQNIKSAKFQLFIQEIESLYAQESKVLIYSQFTSMLLLMRKEFEAKGYRFLYLDGNTSVTERQKQVEEFQEDPKLFLFLISLKAGGLGFTLTSADYVFLYDPWWNDAVENQAIGRAHRIGRSKSLIIKKYITIQSLEENMLELKSKKTLLAQSMESSEENFSLTREDWLHLLR